MTTTLLRNIACLATFDDEGHEWADGAVLMEDGLIRYAGPMSGVRDLPRPCVEIDLSGHLVMPGLVNTHHHFYQCLTRVMAQQSGTFEFLDLHYPVWERLDDQALFECTRLAIGELLLSGCTTTADHHYVFPKGVTLDSQIEGHGRWAFGFMLRAGPCRWARAGGGFRLTTAPRRTRPSWPIANASSSATTTPSRMRCCAWCWRLVRHFP